MIGGPVHFLCVHLRGNRLVSVLLSFFSQEYQDRQSNHWHRWEEVFEWWGQPGPGTCSKVSAGSSGSGNHWLLLLSASFMKFVHRTLVDQAVICPRPRNHWTAHRRH